MPRLPAWTPGHGSVSFVPRCLPAWTLQADRSPFTCLALSPFICLPLSPGAALQADRFTCLLLSPFICLLLSAPGTDSLVPLCLPSFFSFVSQPGCLARLSSPLSPSLDACHDTSFFCTVFQADRFTCLLFCIPSFVSQPRCLARLFRRADSLVSFVSFHLSPVVSQPGCLARLFRRRTETLVSLCLPLFICLPLSPWMPGTALQADRFTCLPLFPFICPFVCLPFSAWMPGAALQADKRTGSLFSHGLPSIWRILRRIDSFLSRCLPAWMLAWLSKRTDSFVFRCLPAWMSSF